MRGKARSLAGVLAILLIVAVVARLSNRGRWNPDGPALAIHGVSLGMTRGQVESAGWHLFGRREPMPGQFSTWAAKQPVRGLNLAFDDTGRVVAIEGASTLEQGDRTLIGRGSSGQEICAAFGQPYPREPRQALLFPEADVAVITQCPGAWGCTLSKLDNSSGPHVCLGGVPASRLGFKNERVCRIVELLPLRRTPSSPLSFDRAGQELTLSKWGDGTWWRVLQGDRVLLQTHSGVPGIPGTSRLDAHEILGMPLQTTLDTTLWDVEIPKGESWWDGNFDYLEARFDQNARVIAINPLDEPPPSYKIR